MKKDEEFCTYQYFKAIFKQIQHKEIKTLRNLIGSKESEMFKNIWNETLEGS